MTAVLTGKQKDTHDAPEGLVVSGTAAPERTVKDLVQLFKLLADETRLKILFLLHETVEMNVLELCKLLEQRQPSVSHHLALLRVAGLIAMRREGKHNFYRILPSRFEQLIERAFHASADSSLRICFEDYELRYAKIRPTAESRTEASP